MQLNITDTINAMFKTLKFKIIAAAFIIISVILTFSAWRDITFTEQAILKSQIEKAALYSDRIEHAVVVLMLKNNWKDLQKFIVNLSEESRELHEVRIFLPDSGIIVASSDPDEIGQEIYAEDMERVREKDVGDAFLIEKGEHRYASKLTLIENLPVCHRCHNPEKKTLGVMDIELSLNAIQNSIQTVKKQHSFDAIIGFLLIGSGFLLVVGVLIDRPIKNMIQAIRRIEGGDSTVRMKELSNDEFGLVARSFNSMLDSLEAAKREIEEYHVAQVQKSAKLASLGEIISGIAHEIKNPLAGISCAVQVFHSELDKKDSRRELTADILNHIRRLDGIVKGLLNYAKPKPPAFLPGKVSDVLDKAIFFIYPEAKKQHVSIETSVQDGLPDAMMDPDQIQQVFLNLMINAVQAMPEGGELKITLCKSEKELTVAHSGITEEMMARTFVRVSFQDSGKGIESDFLKNIFTPFFTKKSKGTGLGLSISKRIVQEHGGEITVSSEIGKGSVFNVYIPAVRT
jgi:signal transduction histidine kinase